MKTVKGRILAAVSLHHACNDASVVALPAIFPVLYTEGILIRRYTDIGTIMLVGLIVAVFTQFLIGHNVKGRHYRCCLALDALIVGIFLLLMTLSRNYFMLAIFFVGVRIGTSIYHPVGISWISKTFKGNNLDRSMGFQSAFGDIGVLAAFTSTGFLAQHIGWKAPLILWGVVNFLVLVAGLLISRGTADQIIDREEKEPVSWIETIRGLRPFIPLLVLGGLAWGVTLGYAPSLINHKLGISMSKTGIILGCWMGAGAISSMLYGRISEFLGRPRTVFIAYTIIIITAFIIGSSDRAFLTITAFIIFGMSIFITYPAILSFVGSSIDAKNRTATFSVVSNFQIIGNSVSAFISGLLSDAYGINTPFFLLGGATFVVALYFVLSIRKEYIRKGPVPSSARPEDIVSG